MRKMKIWLNVICLLTTFVVLILSLDKTKLQIIILLQ